MIKGAITTTGDRVVPFGPEVSPLGAYQSDFTFHERYADLPFERLERFFAGANGINDWIYMSGISLRYLLSKPDLRDTILKKARQGSQLRVLIMHEENEALAQMLAHMPRERINGIKAQINENFAGWKQLGEEAKRFVDVRKLRKGIMYQQMFLTPASVMVTSYSYSAKTSECPVIQANRKSSLYQLRRAEFEALWHSNAE